MKRTLNMILIVLLFILIALDVPADPFAYAAAGKIEKASGKESSKSEKDSGEENKEPEFTDLRLVIKVSVHKDITRIRWKEVEGASYYIVYRSDKPVGKFKKLKKTKALSYNDGSGESGKVYYYKLRAYNKKNKHTRTSRAKKIRTVYRVYIACGHGKSTNGIWDSGCTYNGMQEAKLMLPITRAFVSYMRKSGVFVYTDADTDNDINRDKCINEANKRKISAYISIHCDWHYAPSGTMPLYMSGADKKLAISLNNGVHKMVKIRDRGLTRRADLQELYRTKAVSCTFETGCISKDSKIFRKKYDDYGKGLAVGLCNYLDIDFVDQDSDSFKVYHSNIPPGR